MLPRILSAQFGLLDDGVLVLNSVQSFRDAGFLLRGFTGAGRFIPTTLLFRAIAFYFSGFDPQRWYIWQTIVLILICFGLAFIVRRHFPGSLAMGISVFFFLASPTLIENFYTLSKAEVPLILCMGGAILAAGYYTSWVNRVMKVFVVTLSFTCMLLSFGTKEIALILPFIFLSWQAISWIYSRKDGGYRDFLQSDFILLSGSLVGGAIYIILRQYILGLNDPDTYAYVGEYQLFNPAKMFFSFRNLLGWLLRDYAYLLPIFLASLFLKPLRHPRLVFSTVRWAIWMIAWLAILLPWGYLAYYLLPFLFGAAILSGIVLGQMASLLRSDGTSASTVESKKLQFATLPSNRNWIRFLFATAVILAIPSAINATAYATEQLTIDKANWQFVEQVSKLPPNSRLIINIPEEMEYFYEIQLFIGRILDRPDIQIKSYHVPVEQKPGQSIYIASPYFINQVLPSVRSIDSKSVEKFRQDLAPAVQDLDIIYSSRIEGPILDIGLHRLLFFLDTGDMMGYSARDIVESTTLVYGWDLWEYSP